MCARTETWEGCRWTRIDPPVNVVPSEPTVHQLLFREKRTVVLSYLGSERKVLTWWGERFNSKPFDESRGPSNVRKTIIHPNIR